VPFGIQSIMLTSMTIKILQGSVATQTKLDGLTTYIEVVTFPVCMHTKNSGSCLTVDKVITVA